MSGIISPIWRKLQERSVTEPAAPAILGTDHESVTCAELWKRILRIEAALTKAGVAEDASIALVHSGGPEMLIFSLALSRGHACAPIDPALTEPELERTLDSLGAQVLVVGRDLPAAAAVGKRLGLTVFECAPRSALRLLARSRQKDPRTREAALLLHTSGTTGRGKLVGLTRANLHAGISASIQYLKLGPADRLLLLVPLFHLQGLLSAMIQLTAGGVVIVPERVEAAAIPGWLRELRPTWYTCGPTLHGAIFHLLSESPLPAPTSLRFVRSIGASLPPRLIDDLSAALGAPVLNGYGLTEAGPVATMLPEFASTRRATVGRSCGVEIRIVDDVGAELPPGVGGEIVLRGPTVISRYLNDDVANRDAFFADWFRTGDLGWLDAEGFLTLCGRRKEIINRGGEKIHPAEVDEALYDHPAVKEVACFGVEHPSLGEDVMCAVVVRTRVTEAELRAFAAQRLAPFKVPRKIYFVAAIPRGATGKPQRHLLAERAHVDVTQAAADAAWQGGSMLERFLLELWSDLLQRPDLTLHEDFFSAGGDSLNAVFMLAEAEQRLHLPFELASEQFFPQATIPHLVHMIETAGGLGEDSLAAAIHVIPIQPGSPDAASAQPQAIPLFLVPANTTEGLYFRRLARELGPAWPVALVRPGGLRHRATADTIARAAQESVEAILAQQPSEPFVVGGFCYGGSVAFEAARLLEKRGCKVALILFDAPIPGFPQVFRLRDARQHLAFAGMVLKMFTQPGRRMHNLKVTLRKVTWHAGLRLQSLLRIFTPGQTATHIVSIPPRKGLPFHRLHPIALPVLNLVAETHRNPLLHEAFLRWDQVAVNLTQHRVPGNHETFFTPPNYPPIASALKSWLTRIGFVPAAPYKPRKAPASEVPAVAVGEKTPELASVSR